METKLNIAEILKDKPKGTKLYTDAFGELSIEDIFAEDELGINLSTKDGDNLYFYNDGKYNVHGEPILFPSKEMRDWSKFAWKEGDILVNKDGDAHIIFAGFDDDTYETFNGNNYLWENEGSTMCFGGYEDDLQTSEFNKANKEDAQKYIHKIKKRLGGKLNHETLEIEKPEFKDGDIVVTDAVPSMWYSKCILILKEDLNKGENSANSYVFYNINNGHINFNVLDTKIRDRNIHLATDEEKQQLFDALTKEGKAWDAEKKEVVDLKPKVKFKPMDLCLMKYIGQYNNRGWELCQYAYTEHRVSPSGEQRDFYHSVGGEIYAECIPYNEDTKHLLGTKDKWKGGEQ